MALVIGSFHIEDIEFGQESILRGKSFIVNKEALCDFLMQKDDRIQGLNITLVKPEESTRIICVKDVIEPWCKVSGNNPGEGVRHVVKNVAVVTCGKIVGFQEGIIDMSGPGAAYTPFSKTFNVVLEIEVAADLSPHQHEEVVRQSGLAAAQFLGETVRTNKPDLLETFDTPDGSSVSSELPKVVYVYMLLSQGLLHDTYVLGVDAKEGLPRSISPKILLDGAITSGNCVSACDKNTTWHHQNNPLLRELYQRHGKELNFGGVVLTNEPVRLAAKQASSAKGVELVKQLGADGVIISKEGFGNPDADLMMLIRGLEKAGIKTVAISDEYAGPDGGSQSLADVTSEADAVITVGNANERILLPPLDRLLGPIQDLAHLAGAYPQSLREDGSLEIELQGIIGATNQLGSHTLSCREV